MAGRNFSISLNSLTVFHTLSAGALIVPFTEALDVTTLLSSFFQLDAG
jgi:hypothetical protein